MKRLGGALWILGAVMAVPGVIAFLPALAVLWVANRLDPPTGEAPVNQCPDCGAEH